MPLVLTYDESAARVRLVWTGSATATVTLWRRAGRYNAPWTFVRGAFGVSGLTGLIDVWDYEMPIDGTPTEYCSKSGTGIPTVASPGANLTSITVLTEFPWLRHLGIPALNMPCTVQSIGDLSNPGRLAVYEPHGRKHPVLVHDVRGSRRGVVRLLTRTADESARIRSIAADGAPLLLQTPDAVEIDFEDCYMGVHDLAETRIIEGSRSPARIWSFSFTEVDRPAGDAQPAVPTRTYATALSESPTYADARTDYPTYTDALLGTP
jgi:hypothetical protein